MKTLLQKHWGATVRGLQTERGGCVEVTEKPVPVRVWVFLSRELTIMRKADAHPFTSEV